MPGQTGFFSLAQNICVPWQWGGDHDEDIGGGSRMLHRTKRMIRTANRHCVDRHQRGVCPWALDYISFPEVRKPATHCTHKFKLCLVYEENESRI